MVIDWSLSDFVKQTVFPFRDTFVMVATFNAQGKFSYWSIVFNHFDDGTTCRILEGRL